MIIIKVKVNIKQVMLGTAALAGLLVTSQAVANADSMTIKAGDTVWAYSQKYNVSVKKIAEENGLSNPSLIIAGQKIDIPGVKTGSTVAKKAATKTTTASASSATSTSAATSTSSQATSATAVSSSVTSASSTSQAASSSSVAAQSSSTSQASASSSVASSSSVVSQASSSAVTSSATSTSSQAPQSAATSQSSAASQSSVSSQAAQPAKAASYVAPKKVTTPAPAANYGSVIGAAKTFLGTPYEQMDCSAFTQAAFAKIGRSIGRTTYAQATVGTHVSFGSAQAGDLVFWGSDSAPYHVGIYLGGGQYIASPTYGETVSIKSTAYYTPSFAIHM
ncbi:gamma-D-glutamate-meso-diaminopimelate muropeptidase [Lactiplantibacillus xiangfangensis]|uniref:Gamma-D-glutamate-meso-diaminopimelate muropeptidase n=1 Tax=Lactiplantibacillus xiangfangensis TaxID=942150 RepID=A0A0R2ML01_9LACO|nr:gamma-D-glutamate-meso-diaminopimelate muropeptidase [Lactiplantibacillus xiangfangensis]